MKHEKKYSICGLAWHPKYKQIAYTDNEGNLGLLENIGDAEKPNDKVLSTNDFWDEFHYLGYVEHSVLCFASSILVLIYFLSCMSKGSSVLMATLVVGCQCSGQRLQRSV